MNLQTPLKELNPNRKMADDENSEGSMRSQSSYRSFDNKSQHSAISAILPLTQSFPNMHGRLMPKKPTGRSFLNGSLLKITSNRINLTSSPIATKTRSRNVLDAPRLCITDSHSQPPMSLRPSSMLINAPPPVRKLHPLGKRN
jgi:hypothetical protein